MIEDKDLVIGAIYEVSAMRFPVAVWTGEWFRGVSNEGDITEEAPFSSGLPFGTARAIWRLGSLELKPAHINSPATRVFLDALNQLLLERDN